jgi:spermidine/putrescine transport system ATP-binding protein
VSVSTAAVEVRQAVKVFGQGENGFRALDAVSVRIEKGEFFTLLGPSGCGKTTLLRLIAGFESPSSGEILLDGRQITHLPPNKRPVNTVFQSYALFPHLSVAQNIAFGLEMLGRPKAEVAARVEQMLALVKLEPMAGRRSSQLSGGQQQRVALARALAPQPKVLLLDEPLSALDLKLRKEMQVELKRLQTETGITFIFVTHDQEEALTMSDRIGVMNAGKIQQLDTPRQLYTRPANRFVASFIGETNFLDAQLTARGVFLANADGSPGARMDVACDNRRPGTGLTLTIRPEQLRITQSDAPDSLAATVTDLVYFGTDTHLHLRLAQGATLTARLQTSAEGEVGLSRGQAIGVRFAPGALQVLED